MNKAILMGRLTRDPEIRYSNGETPLAIARYSLAVSRKYKSKGQPDVDFINCTAFGKSADFAEQWLKEGLMIAVDGRIQVSNYTDKKGHKRTFTEIVVESHYFTGDKSGSQSGGDSSGINYGSEDFKPIEEDAGEEDFPF